MSYSVQSTFACGIGRRLFDTKYAALSDEERARIERVAWRLWASIALRYHVSFHIPHADTNHVYRLTHTEIPSYSLFALFGCIDTLSQKADEYKTFLTWFRERTDAESFSRSDVEKLYKRYNVTFGVGSNLQRLFHKLPKATTDWLTRHVVIHKHDEDPKTSRLKKKSAILDGIYRYFYKVRRNPFAHQSMSHQTYTASDIGVFNDMMVYTPTTYGYIVDEQSGQRWVLSFTDGLDEEIILKVIIQSTVLQKIGIEVTDSIIGAFLTHHSRQHAMYSFAQEVRDNAGYLSWLRKFNDMPNDQYYVLYYMEIPQVTHKWATILAGRLIVENNTMETGLKAFTEQYSEVVQRLNETIQEFNQTHPRARPATDELPARIEAIKTFIEGFRQKPDFLFIESVPSRPEIANVELIARDPCYI